MTKEEFHKIITKPDIECDGVDFHFKSLWKHNDSKSIFYLTGLDFSNMLGEKIPIMNIKRPHISAMEQVPKR